MSQMIFEQWVFGRTTGSKYHAVKRNGPHRNPITGSPEGAYTMHALCGARDAQGMLNAGNELFNPSAKDNVCNTCARRWTARHAPQMPGWTKACNSCGQEKSINQFHVDRRTRDNLSTRCLDCEEGAKRAVKQAERLLEQEARRQRALAEAHQDHQSRLTVLTRWQAEPSLPTFTCAHGHALVPVTGARTSEVGWAAGTVWPSEQWECPCGLADVPREQLSAAVEASHALDTLARLRASMADSTVDPTSDPPE